MAQEVLIEFLADYTSLDKAIDVLEKTGKVDAAVAQSFKATNAEISKQSQLIKNTAPAFKAPIQSIEQLDKKTKQFVKDFIDGFQEGINEELKRAKPEIDAFKKKLEEAGKGGTTATQSLKAELRQLTEQIARAKASGGPVDAAMIERAGQLRDAIQDANAEISNAGSDTRGLDNVVGSISALAGGFSAVQGAIGLFSEDNEELQRVLLKVNSAMALATGIQQVANAVQKEGALTKLADVVATKAQIAVQQIYTFVTGRATAATVAFKVALATTGIGLLVIGILALVNALKDSADETEDLIKKIDDLRAANEGFFNSIGREEREQIALLEERGAKESEISNLQLDYLEDRIRKTKELKIVAEAAYNQSIKNGEADAKLAEEFTKANQEYLNALTDRRVLQTNIRTQEADEFKKANEERIERLKRANEKALQLARELRAAEFADFKAGKELEVLAAKEGSDEQLAARKELLRAELAIGLENEKLTNNQKKLLIQQFFKDRIQLEKDFNKANNERILNDIASDLNSELQLINLSNERKLELTESLLDVQAGLEIAAANGNAAKIQEINAKRDRAILEARKASLQAAADYELSLSQANNGTAQRALQRVSDDEKQKLDVRINAINQLEQLEEDSINKRLDTNQRLYDEGLINAKEFELTEAQLLDQRNKVWEDAEIKRADITERENERIKQNNIELIEDTITILSEVVNVMDSNFQLQAAKENEQLAEQKQKLKDLQDAGAITEKQAITRQKRLEAEERKIKQRQAQREKQVAVFEALLNIPRAILQGLAQGGPILAAIYGGLATVQAGIVIARPVPKFSKGKKDNYEGPGIMGEAGAELIQRADGSMHVATKPTLVYVGSKDKIFTHTETKSMLPHVDRSVMRQKESANQLDYDKLAAAIIKGYKPTPGSVINIDKEFISESVANGLLKNNYFDRYYKS